jgi:hypothetical protein
MTSETPEQLVAHFRERFSDRTDTQIQVLIAMIWLAGSTEQLACLGVISGDEIDKMDGMDRWAEIDRHRYRLIPPNTLNHCLAVFVKAAAIEGLRTRFSEVLTMYYTDSGRHGIASVAFDRIFMNPSTN